VLQFLWPSPPGVLVQGTVVGGLTALVAFGIVLIYRANRIINFAQGDMGAAPASFTVLLIVGPGVPFLLALPLGLLFGAALGALIEFGIIRRFFKAPRLILTVATIAISQILIVLGLVMPQLFDMTIPPQSYPSPLDFSFRIHPIVFRGNDIVAMLAIPITIAVLAAFFRYTSIGVAVRASAESSERAFLVGIPVKRIQTIVWVMASLLSTMALILRAGIVGLPIGTVLGPTVLVAALAAAVIGRMEKLPTVFVAAVGLGILEQSIVWHTGRSVLVAPVMLGVILAALLLQRRGQQARADEGSSWQAATEVRPVPQELAGLPEVKWSLRGLQLGVLILALVLPVLIPESRTNLMAMILIFAVIGISLVVLTGWAGQISLGQMGLVAIGAAVAGSMTTRLGWDLALSLVGAGIVGAVVALLIGLPALRMKGLFLAVTTLAFAVTTSSFFLSRDFFGWWLPQGRIPRTPLFGTIAVDTETRYYYLCLAGLLLALAMARGLRQSRTGRVLIGVRENERAAQAFGINATRAKLTAFGISGFLAAYAGGLFVHHQQGLGINPFAAEQSLVVFTMVVIGGLGSVPGAILGAAYILLAKYFIPGIGSFMASGLGLLLILLLLPGGLGSLMYQVRDAGLRYVAGRRKILVPSLVADSREFKEKDNAWDFAFTKAEATAEATELAGAATAGGPLTSGEEMRQAAEAGDDAQWAEAEDGSRADAPTTGVRRAAAATAARRRKPLEAKKPPSGGTSGKSSGRTKR
jgi:branched-chain amino acid transport system permease protein